jgi:tRNA pseudouridine55 synthase
VIYFYKNQGETPLDALNRLRASKPELKDETLSYAGRLDPMAEGILLVLVGSENNERDKYLKQDKSYEAEILFGFETDTFDVLGKIVETNETYSRNIGSDKNKEKWGQEVKSALLKFEGTYDQAYPPYSSQPVNGKPLFQWAREGKLSEIIIPTKKVTIYSTEVLEMREINSGELLKNIESKILKVNGDFRQDEILTMWRNNFENQKNFEQLYQIAKVKVACSSGTYIRSLAHELGKVLNSSGVLYSLMRTKVGKIGLEDCIKLD